MASIVSSMRTTPRWPEVLYGGLLVALGDMAFATTLWFSWDLDGLARMFRSIAAGVLGPASAGGGAPAAWLGVGLHVAMASSFVLAYTLAGWRMPRLLRHPVRDGIAYGVLLYVAMNFVVMPLSRIGSSPTFARPDWITMSVIAHMVFGVICVVFAGRALRSRHRTPRRRQGSNPRSGA